MMLLHLDNPRFIVKNCREDAPPLSATSTACTILGVQPSSSAAELKAAFFAKVKQFHPDVNKGKDADTMIRPRHHPWRVEHGHQFSPSHRRPNNLRQRSRRQFCHLLSPRQTVAGVKLIYFSKSFSFIGAKDGDSLKIAEPLEGPILQQYCSLAKELGFGCHEEGPHLLSPSRQARISNPIAGTLFSKLSDDVVLNILVKLKEDPQDWARLACTCTKISSMIHYIAFYSR